MSKEKYQVTIKGMHCAACSSRIERVVGNLDGVVHCSVNLATEKALIDFDPSATSEEMIQGAIAGLGFGAEKIVEKKGTSRLPEEPVKELAGMKKRLLPAFLLAVCIMFLSMGPMVGVSLPAVIHPDTAPLLHTVLQFLLVLPVLYLGRSFYLNGMPSLFRGIPNMDSLVALGTGAAFVYSTWNMIEIGLNPSAAHLAHDLYFESAAMLLALISLGKYLEARSKVKTGDAIRQLMQLAPEEALVLDGDGNQIKVAVEDIGVGDIIVIRPGERIPVDGIVTGGDSSVDESMLTGESMAVVKTAGDSLFSGTLNKNGSLAFKATRIGKETTLARIIELVQNAQGSKAPIANLADRISLYFVPVVIVIALLAGLSWYFIGGTEFSFALRIFIAVLVIACPCAMGLATPTSIMVGTGRGAQLGVLVKTGEVLERAKNVSCVVFDKTGTLTKGRPVVTDIIITNPTFDEQQLMALSGGAESRSEHPLADAIVASAKHSGYERCTITSFHAITGKGVQSSVELGENSYDVLVGNKALLVDFSVAGMEKEIEEKGALFSEQGKTPLYLAVDGSLAALLVISDPVKEEAASTVKALGESGLEVVMLTGDNEKTARAVAKQASIGQVISEVLPDRKEAEVVRLQDQGHIVAMVGDGINDAPSLARADVGIAMGTGIDVAMESADIVLMSGDLSGVVNAIGLSHATLKNIRQNLFWAFAYNVITIPVAAGLLVIFGGPALNPMIGGAAMALSSVSVVTNALRLRFFRPVGVQ